MQVFRLASCLFLQAQSSSPTSAPAVFSVFRALFSCNPVVFLETAGFFQIATPQALFSPLSTPPSQISETARTAGRCDRRGARTTPRLCPASPLAASPSAEIRPQASFLCVCRPHNAPARRRNVWFSAAGWVRARLGCESRTNRRHGRDGRDWRFGCAFNLCFQ